MLGIVIAATVMTLFVDLPFGNLKKLIFDTKKVEKKAQTLVDVNGNIVTENEKKIS
jgi:hypothetical protein